MSVYLIDYENVHASGLTGVENCGIEDEIILLYGNDTSTIPMELHIQIANSKGKVQYHKIERTGKNYLDFQQIFMLQVFSAALFFIPFALHSRLWRVP